MINISTFSSEHITLATSLFYYLGGIKNITLVDSCLSRLRINITNSHMTRSDEEFLQLKAKGVIRTEHSIHLLFGKQSLIIQQILQCIINTINDNFSLDLLLLCGGRSHIKQLSFQNNCIMISLDNSFQYSQKQSELFSQEYGIPIHYTDSNLTLTTPDSTIISLENMIQLWDILQSQIILDLLDPQNIKEIQYSNSYFKIWLHDLSLISDSLLQDLEISKICKNTEEQTLELCISDHLAHILQYNYLMYQK